MHSCVYGQKWHGTIPLRQRWIFFLCFDKYFSRTLAFYLLVRERSFQSTYFRVTSLEQLSSYLLVREHSFQSTYFRVTSLEQLSLAEFTGGTARPKVSENNHKNVLAIYSDLEKKVNYSTILVFKVIFLCQKSTESFWFFFRCRI